MKSIRRRYVFAFALALGTLLVTACAGPVRHHVDKDGGKVQLTRLLDQALPPVIREENSGLVSSLLTPALGKPLRQTFDRDKAVRAVFGTAAPRFTPGCQDAITPVGEPDQGECVAEFGEETGTGAYTRFTFSKNLGLGNLAILTRPAVRDLKPEDVAPLRLTDDEAFERAQTFVQATFGLDLLELPSPPAGAKMLPVSTLTVGFGLENRLDPIAPIALQKVVYLQRGLAVTGVGDPRTGLMLPYLPAPGRATIIMDDRGVVAAMVEDWQEIRIDPRMDPRLAKSRRQLIDEIADDLASEGIVDVARLSSLLVISTDWRGTHGILVPAIRVFLSPVPRDLTEQQQRALEGRSTAGLVREYSLVHRRPQELETR